MSTLDPERWTTSDQPEDSAEARVAALLKRVPPPLPLTQTTLDRLYHRVHQHLARSVVPRWRVPRFAVALVIACVAPLSYAAIRSPSVKAWIHALPTLWRAAPPPHAPASIFVAPPAAPSPVMEMPAVDLSQPDPVVPRDDGRAPPAKRGKVVSTVRSQAPSKQLTPVARADVPPADRAPEAPAAAEPVDAALAPKIVEPRVALAPMAQTGQKLCPEPPFHWSKDEPADPPSVTGKLVPCDSIPRAQKRFWDCEKPFGYFGSGDVHIRVSVDNRAQARRIEIIDATDAALAEATRTCAMRQAYETGKDASGAPVGGYTDSIHVHYQ